MSDDDVRALFHRIDDGPPLGVDAREVMARGRRVRALRTRLTIAGSGLTVAAAAVVGGLLLGGGAQEPAPDINRPAGPPSETSSTNTTVPVPRTTPPGPGGNPTSHLEPPPGEQDDPVPGATSPAGNGPGANPPVATSS